MVLNQTDIETIRELIIEETSQIRGQWFQFVEGNFIADGGIAVFALSVFALGYLERELERWRNRIKTSFLDVYKTLVRYRDRLKQEKFIQVGEDEPEYAGRSKIYAFLRVYDEKIGYIDGLMAFYPESRDELKDAFEELFSFLDKSPLSEKRLNKAIKNMVDGLFLREDDKIKPIESKIRFFRITLFVSLILLLVGIAYQSFSLYF